MTDLVEELCPECGAAMEPASGTAELVGFRLITSLEIQRWVDDGGLMAEAIAMPWPERS